MLLWEEPGPQVPAGDICETQLPLEVRSGASRGVPRPWLLVSPENNLPCSSGLGKPSVNMSHFPIPSWSTICLQIWPIFLSTPHPLLVGQGGSLFEITPGMLSSASLNKNKSQDTFSTRAHVRVLFPFRLKSQQNW